MDSNFTSALLAGVIAAVCWTSFSFMFGEDNLEAVGTGALIFLVLTTIGTLLIAQVISRRKRI